MNAATTQRAAALRELRTIPGVGKTVAVDFWNLGLRRVADLRRRDPERLYAQLCRFQGGPVDRCMLYVIRCAVYFASTARPKAELLKWWNWERLK